MESVNRSGAGVVRTTPEETSGPQAPPSPVPAPSTPAVNQVVAAPVGLANGDSYTEAKLREEILRMGPGDALELSGAGGFKADVAAEGKARMRLERQKDGSLTLTVEGHGELGVGASGAGAAKVGIAAGTRFHFAAGEEANAADLCDALAKGAVVTALPIGVGLAAHAFMTDGDLGELPRRITAHTSRVSALSVGATGAVELSGKTTVDSGFASFNCGGAKAQALVREELVIDLERGELVRNRSVALSADAGLQVPMAFKVQVNGKATATLSAGYALTPEMKQAVLDKRMTPLEAWAQLADRSVPDRMTASVEIEQGGRGVGMAAGGDVKAKSKAQITLHPKDFLDNPDPAKVLEDVAKARWTMEGEVGYGPAFAADYKGNKLEFSAQRKHVAKTDGLTLGEALAGAGRVLDGSDANLVDARRAAANLY